MANSYIVIFSLAVCITCKIAICAFNSILEHSRPKYNAYLENRVNFHLKSNIDHYASKYHNALEYARLIKDDPMLKQQCIRKVEQPYRAYWSAEIERLRQGKMCPKTALQFAEHIPFEDIKQAWMAALKPCATYASEEAMRLLNQYGSKEAMQFADTIPYKDIRQQCIAQNVFEETLQKLLASDEADPTKIDTITGMLNRCHMNNQRKYYSMH